ncbi:hypothetical protein M9H77_23863 [Catharanthus roseus]|uniref:Uncharacterized protein n=1 Tax=Catharanthus roseus TaxID=4058 RepID=A0ACC0AUI3_CATRO|nr:hypothetical protein M9H77_23863 [Catharanthus roseus]
MKIAKYGRKGTLRQTVALPLLLPVGFYRGIDESYHTYRRWQVLRHLFQHGKCIPSYETSLERTRTTIFMPSKGCQGLKTRKEANYEQSSIRDFGGNPMHDNQWGYGNFSPQARSYEHNFYDCYEGKRFGT